MLVQNNIPILAVIIENFIGLFMLFLAFRAFVRYRRRRTKISRYVAYAITCFALAVTSSGIGKYIDFTSSVSQEVKSYSDMTIVIAYCFLTLGNVFFAVILPELYLSKDNQLPLLLIIGNSIVIGLLIPNISTELGVYDAILFYLIFFIVITTAEHGTFAILSYQEMKNASNKITKTGFGMIGLFSTLVIMVLVFFVVDLVVGIIQDSSYTPFYYAGWITVGLSTLVAFLGFLMPDWFKNLIS